MRVIQYNSWTEWNISSKIDPDTILYSGPVIECPIEDIRGKYTTSKYVVVLKRE
jgi:hypothetical protein